MDTPGCNNIRKAAKPSVGCGSEPVKVRDRLAYLTADLLRRSSTDGCEILRLEIYIGSDKQPQMAVHMHTKGDFFDI